MKIMVINGPSINLLGIREKNIYGTCSYQELLTKINYWAKELDIEVNCYQSNHEGDLVDFIQNAYFDKYDGIIINPAAYTHTSIAILDALKAVNIPSVEVHISNIEEREEFRKKSYISEVCFERVIGKGIDGYKKALQIFKERSKE